MESSQSKLPAAKAKLDEATKEMLKQHINFLQKLLQQYGDDDEAAPASSAAAPSAPAAAPAASPAAPAASTAPASPGSHGAKMEGLFSTVSCLGVQCCLTCCDCDCVTLLFRICVCDPVGIEIMCDYKIDNVVMEMFVDAKISRSRKIKLL